MVNFKACSHSILAMFSLLNIVNSAEQIIEPLPDENADGFVNICPTISCDTTISDLTCYQSDG